MLEYVTKTAAYHKKPAKLQPKISISGGDPKSIRQTVKA